ncbi:MULTISPECIES: hypothetical protein [unclassified Clostridium]|uniref:hypothetical protein n=1 Tax=unclassified Clostridium TaxID=2614128 RepID=UPI0002972EAD|nr:MULTISPECIES: hypothetical protein [unclassified Clostridium]EKQ52657.1 MAG: hypothetical protein A370_04077 [Clostridium sp. Maddingley MBC34-26]
MDEEIVIQHIGILSEKYRLLYSNKKIVIAPDFEIRIRINTNQKNINFHEYIFDDEFNIYSINYTINRTYRCYYLIDKYKDFDKLENAIEFCIKVILENYKKVFKS